MLYVIVRGRGTNFSAACGASEELRCYVGGTAIGVGDPEEGDGVCPC